MTTMLEGGKAFVIGPLVEELFFGGRPHSVQQDVFLGSSSLFVYDD